jgi:hypothetical protein
LPPTIAQPAAGDAALPTADGEAPPADGEPPAGEAPPARPSSRSNRPGVDRSTCGPISVRCANRNVAAVSSVMARCEAQVTGKPPRSARKMTNSNP